MQKRAVMAARARAATYHRLLAALQFIRPARAEMALDRCEPIIDAPTACAWHRARSALAAICAWLYFAGDPDQARLAPSLSALHNPFAAHTPSTPRTTTDESPVAAALAPIAPFTASPSRIDPSPMPKGASADLPDDRARVPDLLIAAPLEASHGTIFTVTIGIASRSALHSVHLRLSYDVDALELINVADSAGTTFATMPNGDGSVDLDVEDMGRAAQMPAATFLARVIDRRTIEFAASAELRDAEGHALDAGPIAPAAMMLVP